MNEARLKGNFTGGHLLYGYKVEKHKVIIDEEQAKVIRYIFEQYVLGAYVKDIIDHLTQNRIFNKNKPFARNTVYKILKNEKYFGIYRHNEQTFDNIYPAIVSTEIYEKVRSKIDLNKYGKRSTTVVYLLRHKIKCGYCGQPINAECGTNKAGKKMHYYKCMGRKLHSGCHKSVVRKEVLEDLVIKKILEILKSPKYMQTIVDNLMQTQSKQANSPLLSALLKEQKQTQTALDNIVAAIEQGIINNTTNKRMKELEKQLADLEKQTLLERSKNSYHLTRQEITDYYLTALQLEPKLLIDYLIQKITLYDDKIEITFNTPLKSSPATPGFSFTINKTPKTIII